MYEKTHCSVDLPLTAIEGRLLRWIAKAIVCLLVLLLLEASPSSHAQTDQLIRESELGGPQLRLLSGVGHTSYALQLSSDLKIRVTGLLATATLTQRFRNESADWMEAEYLLPLPHDAAVHRMDFTVGERRVVGEIRERGEARKVFDAARKAGKRSALLEQQRPHLFTTRVANVPPGEEVAVSVDMIVPVTYLDGEFSLRFPTTVTAPYIPGRPLIIPSAEAELVGSSNADGSEPRVSGVHDTWLPLAGSGWALPTRQVPDAPLISAPQRVGGPPANPINPLSLELVLNPGIPLAMVDALYHELAIERADSAYRIRFERAVVEMDRDLVLRWRPQGAAQPQAAVFRERFDGADYGMLMLLPPTGDTSPTAIPRELVLVIDVSGSMQGEPIRQAKESALHALAGLGPQDSVNLIAFSNQYRQLFESPRRADARSLKLASAFVGGLSANGGTEMLPALHAALTSDDRVAIEKPSGALRQIVFITDGAVGNEQEMLSLLERERGAARLFTVGIGSAPNSYFMHRAAEVGRGEAVFIGRSENVANELDALFGRIAMPMASAIEVDWPARVEAFPSPIPDLYQGQPVLQMARLEDLDVQQPIRVRGEVMGKAWEKQITLPQTTNESGVATAWARQKIAALLVNLHRGVPRPEVRAQVLPLALQFSLVSPFTSFVAVEEKAVRPLDAQVVPEKLPNVTPAGQAVQRFALAQGATSGPVKLYLGLLFAFIALFGFALNRPEPL